MGCGGSIPDSNSAEEDDMPVVRFEWIFMFGIGKFFRVVRGKVNQLSFKLKISN